MTKTQENVSYKRGKRSALSQQLTTGLQGTICKYETQITKKIHKRGTLKRSVRNLLDGLKMSDGTKTQIIIKIRKKAKIRNRYNQIPNLTQDTIWEGDKNHKKKEVSPFQAGHHKAASNRQDSMTNMNTHKIKALPNLKRSRMCISSTIYFALCFTLLSF